MSNKIDRALYGPSLTEVFIGALLSLVLGAVLSAVYLVTKPVSTVREFPKEPVADVVYYLPGSNATNRGRTWQVKRQQLVRGQSVEVSEDELNAAAIALSAPEPKKAGDKAEPVAEAKPGTFTAGTPNFRLYDGQMQIAVPVTVSAYGLGIDLIVQARGAFTKSVDKYVFTPSTLLVGSCAVEKLPWVSGAVMNKIVAAQAVPEDIAAAWADLVAVSIEGAKLKLAAQ